MLKYTERVGGKELSYEGETVQDVVDLKNALNPSMLIASAAPREVRIADGSIASMKVREGGDA